MKQRITRKELEALTGEQQRRLTELWTPSLYDVAVARVIKNVATDEYDEYEFVIGGISLHGTSIYLTDITAGSAALGASADGPENRNEAEPMNSGDPALSVNVDPVFGESYPSFGGRDVYHRAMEGMQNALEGRYNDYEEETDEEEEPEEFNEEDLEENYQHPDTLIKSDCTPLLSIGSMIEILKNNNYGKHDFFLSASTYNIGCELGREDMPWAANTGWEPAELCDVLWESVKELL